MAAPSSDLPPGQTATQKFPVTGEKSPGRTLTAESWTCRVEGAVNGSSEFDFDALMAMPQGEFRADIHCVTSWSQRGMSFQGVRLIDVLRDRVEIDPAARFVHFEAYSARRHDTSLPLDLALEDSWLVHSFDGKPLTAAHGFPVRVVTPSRYFYKSLKWLRKITLLKDDRLGFWERTSAYHNEGDPWLEQRLDGRRFTSSAEAETFKRLEDFTAYREDDSASSVVVKASFRDWKPRTLDLRDLRLKACDFRGADLRGANLTGANLTLGQFEGADLQDANLTGADLEGAQFAGAHLAGAILNNNALSATVFQRPGGYGLASHEGLQVRHPQGLLESQETYLKTIGAMA